MNSRIVIDSRGGPERLVLHEEPEPTPGPGQALVRNEAVGVAFADVLMREGLYPNTRFPLTPGYECVGVVQGVGAGVDPGLIGRRMAALTVTGGYARRLVVEAADLVDVPDGLSSPQAASLVLNGLTAFQMLTRCAPVWSRDILVWGAAGGVGSVLLELGRARGLKVYGVASGRRVEAVQAHGAMPINRGAGDVAAQLLAITDGGVDAVFDGVGGKTVETSLKALRSGGTAVLFGLQAAAPGGRRNLGKAATEVALAKRWTALDLMGSNRSLKGYIVTEWKQAHPDHYREDLAAVFALAAEGAITPQIDAVLPLAQAAEAHRRLNAGEPVGKLILDPWA